MSVMVKQSAETVTRTNGMTALQLLMAALRRALPRGGWFIPALLALAAAGFGLSFVPPLLVRRLIDQHLAAGIVAGLWRLATLYLSAYLAGAVVGFCQSYLTTWIGERLLLQLRLMLTGHFGRLPIGYFNRTPAGEIISRVTSDVDSVSNLFSSGLLNAFTELFRIGGVFVGMYIISPRLLLLSLAVVPVIYAFSDWFRRHMFEAEMRIRRSVGSLNAFIQETLNGLRVIKSFGREARYAELFQGPLADNVRVSNTAAFYVSAFPCVMQLLRAAIIGAVVWAGARTAVTDTLAITIGGLAAMVDLLGRMLDPVEAIANEVQVLQQAFAGLSRLAELMSVEPEARGELERLGQDGTAVAAAQVAIAPSSGTGGPPPLLSQARRSIELDGVGFGYREGQPVVNHISLSVAPGAKAAIVGRTGAGKTTIMNLIAGLYAPWGGQVRVAGYDPHRLDPDDRRRLIGVVPQTPAIFEGTVHDNITLGDDAIPAADVEEASRLVGLHEHVERLAAGYQTVLGAGGIRLSHGQNQLLSIARAVVCRPPVLLLDEPTSGMDTETEARVFAALRAASLDRTIITISHRVSGIIDADVVFVLANGRVVQSGTPAELGGRQGWYAVFRQLEELGWRVS